MQFFTDVPLSYYNVVLKVTLFLCECHKLNNQINSVAQHTNETKELPGSKDFSITFKTVGSRGSCSPFSPKQGSICSYLFY